MSKFFYTRETTRIYCDRVQNSHNAQKSKQRSLLAGQKQDTFYTLVWADSREWKAQSLRGKWRNQSQMNAWMNSQWIRTWKVNADWKIGQFFAGFFRISKKRKLHCSLTGQKFWSHVSKEKLNYSSIVLFLHRVQLENSDRNRTFHNFCPARCG